MAFTINDVQQNFLLLKIDELIKDRRKNPDYKNIITTNEINPNDFINKFYKLPDDVYEAYVEMTPLQHSFLYPHISLYRTVIESNGQKVFKRILNNVKFDPEMLEIYNNFSQPESIFENSTEITGVGIERIVISNNPERDSDVNIKVTIDLFIESIIYLLHEDIRSLITVPLDKRDVNGIDHRVKLTFGWNVPNDFSKDSVITDKFKKALEYSYQSILCELYRHDLTFNENGSINLKLEYIGGLDGFIKSKQADIINPENYINNNSQKIPKYKENLDRIKLLKQQIEETSSDATHSEEDRNNKNIEEISKLEEENNSYKSLLLTPLYGKIMLQLMTSGYLKYITFDDEATAKISEKWLNAIFHDGLTDNIYDGLNYTITNTKFQEYNASGISTESDAIKSTKGLIQSSQDTLANLKNDELGELQEEDEETKKEFKQSIEDSINLRKKYNIYYFFLGDLVDIIIETMQFDQKEFKFIFGTFDYVDGDSRTVSYKNFADIPINLYSFLVWWNNYVVSSRPSSYPFNIFIKNLFKDLIAQFFGDFGNTGMRTKLTTYSVNFNVLSALRDLPNRRYTESELNGVFVDKYTIHLQGLFSLSQYMIITARSQYNEHLNAEYENDMMNGIYHYRIAQNNGILKGLSFSKVDNQKLYDARMVNQSLNTAGNILKEHYDVSMTLVGNPLFENGKYFYLDPSYSGLQLGKKITQTIGLGGYYFCLGIEHVISQGNWEMSITGKFHSEPGGADTGKLPFNRVPAIPKEPVQSDPSVNESRLESSQSTSSESAPSQSRIR